MHCGPRPTLYAIVTGATAHAVVAEHPYTLKDRLLQLAVKSHDGTVRYIRNLSSRSGGIWRCKSRVRLDALKSIR